MPLLGFDPGLEPQAALPPGIGGLPHELVRLLLQVCRLGGAHPCISLLPCTTI